MKYSFRSDYCELTHPDILLALNAVGNSQFAGYGLDEYSLRAAELIKKKINAPDADVHFISGGTHANLTVISSILRPYEAVIAVETGHIFVHEAGAIEATGHKVCTAPGINGKLQATDIENIVKIHDDEHMVSPRLVYISQSTEIGTTYSKAELAAISEVCKKHELFLFVDGARLAAALNSEACDLTYADVASCCDAFYIGGTKNGALYGEAIVIVNDAVKKDFRINLKQRGALLAKGAVIGIQFEALIKNNLIDEMAKHANLMAKKLGDGIIKAGYELMNEAQTNMLFPVFPSNVAAALHENYEFYDWKETDDNITVRLVTSWATPGSIVDKFLMDLEKAQ
jgi:threonine aldolase